MQLPWNGEPSGFRWLTRVGIGRRAGSVPIGWYQCHADAAFRALEDALGGAGRIHAQDRNEYGNWDIYGRRDDEKRWRHLGTSDQFFRAADKRT